MLSLGFLASGNGSSLRAIVGAIETGVLEARPLIVVSNLPTAPALDFARSHGIAAICIRTVRHPDAADAALALALEQAGVNLVILSGYLRKLGPKTLEKYHNRVLNIHPALLPDFGGQGMYGRRVHEAVVASGQTQSGASVHLVDGEYDNGQVLAQVKVPIRPTDSAAIVEARVIAAEPCLFVQTLQRIASGDLSLPHGSGP